MTQAIPKLVTFEDFAAWRPEGGRYELHDGVIVEMAHSIPLVIEVVSTYWRDDYHKKLGEYEEIGIKEYWIVDYLAAGGKKFIGNPKQPTISLYQLVDGEYQVTQFRSNERIVSPTLAELDLTAEQIFQAGAYPA
ncbi:MAG: Uma2 family endonuclease [Nostoc sp.]|uniref:Uma2 family endonuclease n=1 Tax=Nostoc sp. TaxID=1180 RepID=UPI002FF58C66